MIKFNLDYHFLFIFLSTIIGTASFTGLSIEYYFYMSMIIGFVNILISILTTILRYFKISEYSEMYRVAHIAWDSMFEKYY